MQSLRWIHLLQLQELHPVLQAAADRKFIAVDVGDYRVVTAVYSKNSISTISW
jgi:hypothetical protein